MKYEDQFTVFKPEVKAATLTLIKSRVWRQSKRHQKAATQEWVNTCSKAYGMEPPKVRFDGRMRSLYGAYNEHSNTIRLRRFSVVTLVHEFRHAMQAQGYVHARNTEDDARAWSLSLFKAVAPNRFRKMVVAGRIQFVREHQ